MIFSGGKMFYKSHIVFRILGALLLIALICAGGYMAFQTGQAQGYLQASAGGTVVTGSQPLAQGQLSHAGYGFMYPHFFPFIGLFGLIPLIFVLMFAGCFFRHIIFGYPHRGYCRCGHRFSRHPFWEEDPECDDSEKKAKNPDEHPEQSAK